MQIDRSPKKPLRSPSEYVPELYNNDALPKDVLIQILTWLPSSKVLNCARVCKTWLAVCYCEEFWARRMTLNLTFDPRLTKQQNLQRNRNIVRQWQHEGKVIRNMYQTTRQREIKNI
jgi:hypothetical protein